MKTIQKILAILFSFICLFSGASPVLANQSEEIITPSGLTLAQMESKIEEIVQAHLGYSTPGAAIAVVKDGQIVFSQGYGYADLSQKTPVDAATTSFGFASTSKLFVWVSVMQLVEQGIIDLDEDINNYLPEDFTEEFGFEMPFTMRHLMNHTAGFGENILGQLHEQGSLERPFTLREALLLAKPRQIFQPGAVSAYSNFGTALAAYVVSNLTNQDFEDYERQNVLLVSRMSNTLNLPHWFDNQEFLSNKANGYTPTNDGFEQGMSVYVNLYPQGAMSGTAQDLAHFTLALTPALDETSPLFEEKETLNNLFTSSSLDPSKPATHHGFMRASGADNAFGHAGDLVGGFISNFMIVPEERFGFVVLANTAGVVDPTSERADIRFDIERLLLGTGTDISAGLSENLPSTTLVEGTFLRGRSMQGTFLEFLDFLVVPPTNVSALDEQQITLTMGPFGSATYKQSAPFVYQRVTADNSLMQSVLPQELTFRMEDGKAVQIHAGNGSDLLAREQFRSSNSLIISSLAIVLTGLFFLLAPIVLLVKAVRRKKKGILSTRFERMKTGLILSGSLLFLNNLIALARILLINMFRTSAEMAPHIWMNYALAGLSVFFFIGSFMAMKKSSNILRGKLAYVLSGLLVAFLIAVLQHWNFFVIL